MILLTVRVGMEIREGRVCFCLARLRARGKYAWACLRGVVLRASRRTRSLRLLAGLKPGVYTMMG